LIKLIVGIQYLLKNLLENFLENYLKIFLKTLWKNHFEKWMMEGNSETQKQNSEYCHFCIFL